MKSYKALCSSCSHHFSVNENQRNNDTFCPVCGARITRQNIHMSSFSTASAPQKQTRNLYLKSYFNLTKKQIALFVVLIVAMLFGFYVIIDISNNRKYAALMMDHINEQRQERVTIPARQDPLDTDGGTIEEQMTKTSTFINQKDNEDEVDTIIMTEEAYQNLFQEVDRLHDRFLFAKRTSYKGRFDWSGIKNKAMGLKKQCNEAIRSGALNSDELRDAIEMLQEIIEYINHIEAPIGSATPKFALL